MKKIILLLFLSLGTLFSQAQFLPNFCDSVSYTFLSGSGGNTTLQLNGILASGFPGYVSSWDWAVCDVNLCFSDTGQTTIWNQFVATDTLKVCLTTYLDVNGATYVCTQCDTLIYDGFGGWIMMNTGNPTMITELEIHKITDGKMYDLLGRELTEVPEGVMYIQNRKKYIKIN